MAKLMPMKPLVCPHGRREHLSFYLSLDSIMDEDMYDSKSNDYSTSANAMPLSSNNVKVQMTCLPEGEGELRIFLVRS